MAKNSKTATFTMKGTANPANETGFLIQWVDNAAFSLGVVNATVAGVDITIFSQTVARGKTFYKRVLASNDAPSLTGRTPPV